MGDLKIDRDKEWDRRGENVHYSVVRRIPFTGY
jgi:hypothetical protein